MLQNTPVQRLRRTGRDLVSFDQRRLWLLDQINEPSGAYHIRYAWRLKGRLDAEVLGDALNEVIARHESLRTSFGVFDGEPVQVVAPRMPIPLILEDLSGRAERAPERLTAEVERPFDLASGPLIRARLLRLAADHHLFIVVMHHIISDPVSVAVLIRELSALYPAFLDGQPCPLPAPPLQHADYAAWQRQRLDETAIARKIEFWRKHLAGAPELLRLPADRPRPPTQAFDAGLERFAIDATVAALARALGNAERASLFMVLWSAFAALLSRYSGQDDIVAGSPASTRGRPELAEMIGFFVNMFPLRADLSDAPTFRTLVRRVRSAVLGSLPHLDLPFERLVTALQPPRRLSHTPLFQVTLSVIGEALEPLKLPGIEATDYHLDATSTAFDLTMALWDTGGSLDGYLVYATALFDEATAARIARQYVTLLAAALKHPDVPLHELPLISAAERGRLLACAAGPASPVLWSPVHRMVEEQVRRTPDATAVVAEQHAVTYGELNTRANQWARRLRSNGVRAESVVGVFAERSVELVVGLLAIAKAGGVFLMLDPEHPAARINLMTTDSAPVAVLTTRRLRAQLPPLDVPLLDLAEDVSAEDGTDLAGEVLPEQAAYVIFTSGSTGRPKGAVNTHAGLANRLLWMLHASALGERDALIQRTPVSFDVSVSEFFEPLVAGARLILPEPDGHRDAGYLADLIEAQRVTVMHIVPALLSAFLDLPDVGQRCRTLRHVFCGGEKLSGELRGRFERCLGAELHNVYGPAEAAIDTTHWVCARDRAPGAAPIGQPIPNTHAYVLDHLLQPTGFGVPGELCLGGVCVGRGYQGRPALTADRFVPDPFTRRPGDRLYRTGDLARVQPDGGIEFLGRLDQQVKLRGMRLEPGEIESLLTGYPGVCAAAVTLHEQRQGDQRLVAYVVAGEVALTDVALASELREFLRNCLPEYAVPSAFVRLEKLPITPSGKLDRAALPPPSADPSPTGTVAPRDELERAIAQIWQDVLGREAIGIDDDFFEVGGHSLLAMKVLTRIEHATGARMAMRALFERPTIRGLAEKARAATNLRAPAS